MNTRIIIRTVVLLAAIAVLASGCDFLQNGGGGGGLQYDMSRLTVTMQGKGVVTQQPAPLSGGKYPKGTTVQLKAAGNMRNAFWTFITALEFANFGAVDSLNATLFGSWTGDLTGTTNPASIQMDTDKSVQAAFSRQGIITITTPGGATAAGTMELPAYAELTYTAGRLLHADYYANPARAGHYMTTSFTYNSLGQCTVVNATDPTGTITLCTTSYTYTASGDISTASLQAPSQTIYMEYTYDSLGRVATNYMTATGSWAFDWLAYCTYDDNGSVQQMDVYQSGTYMYYLTTVDPNGNIIKMECYDQTGTAITGNRITFVYDANGLLTSLTMPMGTVYTSTLGWAPL